MVIFRIFVPKPSELIIRYVQRITIKPKELAAVYIRGKNQQFSTMPIHFVQQPKLASVESSLGSFHLLCKNEILINYTLLSPNLHDRTCIHVLHNYNCERLAQTAE